jgi:hypothetical protein
MVRLPLTTDGLVLPMSPLRGQGFPTSVYAAIAD